MVQTFEKIDRRCVAVVVDPIQSVKGNVVIDAFRLYPGGGGIMMMVNATKPLQSTGNRGHISKSTSQQKQRGCGREYYRLPVRWNVDPVILLVDCDCRWTRRSSVAWTPTSS